MEENNNCFFWVSENIAYIPLDKENATFFINYIHWN